MEQEVSRTPFLFTEAVVMLSVSGIGDWGSGLEKNRSMRSLSSSLVYRMGLLDHTMLKLGGNSDQARSTLNK